MKRTATIWLLIASFAAAAAQTHPCVVTYRDRKGLDANVSTIRVTPGAPDLDHAFELASDEQTAPALAAAQLALSHARLLADTCSEAAAELATARALLYSRPLDAVPHFASAEALFRGLSSPSGLAVTQMEWGIAYWQLGDSTKAIERFTLAADELPQQGLPAQAVYSQYKILTLQNHDLVAAEPLRALLEDLRPYNTVAAEGYRISILNSLAASEQRQGRFNMAVQYLQQATQILAACNCALGQGFRTLDGMSLLELSLGRPAAALHNLELAESYLRRSRVATFDDILFMHKARAYNDLHQYSRAALFYHRALQHSSPDETFIYPYIQSNLGSLYLRLGKKPEGMELLKQAATSSETGDGKCVLLDNLGDGYLRLGDPAAAEDAVTSALENCHSNAAVELLAETYALRAEVRLRRGNLPGAVADIREAQRSAESVRAGLVPVDSYRLGFEQRVPVYDIAVEVYSAAHQDTDALEAAEQGRARAFLDLLATAQRQGRSMSLQATASGETSLPSDLHIEAATLPQLQAASDRLHSTVLSYWVSNSVIHLWVSRSGQPLQYIETPVRPGELERLILATRHPQDAHCAASSPRTPNARTSGCLQNPWRRLYQLLVAAAEPFLPATEGDLLTIVPHGALFEVSFAALQNARGHYLVEQYALHTVPSIGVLAFTQHNEQSVSARAPQYLFVDDPSTLPNDSGGHPLPRLPGTRAEVSAIQRLLPAAQVSKLEGRSATASALNAAAGSATTLHFATHAVLNDNDPTASFLALDASEDDGKLSVSEIYALHLHANLVVLSACGTGLGRVTGDGVAGMGRAFLYAGTSSVLATLWDIADQPTALLLPSFYSAINDHQPPSAALRASQLAMLSALRHRQVRVRSLSGSVVLPPDPVYWAAFTLTGEP